MLQGKKIILIGVICGLFSTVFMPAMVQAETLYVTDRILLGVHQQPSEQSPIIKSLPSGTALEALERQNNFVKIKTRDGVEGWVSETYLMQKQPSSAQYDTLFAQYQKSVETLKSVNEDLTKKERELQIKRDQLSNMTTSMKEMKKQLKNKNGNGNGNDNAPDDSEELKTAQAKIAELTAKITELEKADQSTTPEQKSSQTDLTKLQLENTNLRGRIEVALANLAGEKVPTPEQIAGIRPSYPLWYWALIIVALVIGIAGGLGWMDYQHRKRHGGFRL